MTETYRTGRRFATGNWRFRAVPEADCAGMIAEDWTTRAKPTLAASSRTWPV